jgi:hypothetical protein
MKSDRKYSQDYMKELLELQKSMKSLDAHVTHRLLSLAKEHPDAIIRKAAGDEIKAKSLNKYWVESLSIKDRIFLIEKIEKWLNEKESVKQMEIKI